jgi:DNA-binding CsgD family transcriptional regulator
MFPDPALEAASAPAGSLRCGDFSLRRRRSALGALTACAASETFPETLECLRVVLVRERLVGRNVEIAALARFLDSVAERAESLVLEGEPGVGKTALIDNTVDEAQERGYSVLVAKPTVAESTLSFVGLSDLLRDVRDAFADLPSPQRRALEVALLLEDSVEAAADPAAIGHALLGTLRTVAGEHPVIVAVDDLQWLDEPSTAALTFALRRVENERIGLIATIRRDPATTPSELDVRMRSERFVLGPISLGALYALLRDRLELSIPRALLIRVHDACGGNPLFALEIGRALLEHGLPEPGEPFDIPADAEALFCSRIAQLPRNTIDALAVTAAAAAPTRALVVAACGPKGPNALDAAVEAGIISMQPNRIRFAHPLYASATLLQLEDETRRAVHWTIAGVVDDPEERARHLALAAEGPEAGTAEALDAAARHAAARGALSAAAELAELAVKATPPGDFDLLQTRRRASGRHHLFAGDAPRSRQILEALVVELPPGTDRAQALLQLALAHTGEQALMLRLREQAAVEAVGDDEVLAEALRELALTLFVTGHPVPALGRAREAVAAAERAGDVRLLVSALAYLIWIEIWNGQVTSGLVERALALEKQVGYLATYQNPVTVDAVRLMILEDDLEAGRMRLERAERITCDHGDDISRVVLLAHLSELECRAGRLEEARRYAIEAYELREQLGFNPSAILYHVALVDAWRGDREAAQVAAERGLELSQRAGYETFAVRNLRVLGLLALSAGDASTAARTLAPLRKRLEARGYGRLSVVQALPDAVEALIAAGETEEAAVELAKLNEIAESLASASTRARAARCRGLLAAANGDATIAFAALEDALATHATFEDPLEHGRALLALGQTRRRFKQRRLAKQALDEALEIFERHGAALWAERARADLSRLGLRRGAPSELTPTEQRVAELAASGLRNREIAGELFLTPKSVEDVLRRVYRKLDIHSRAELGARMATSAGRH